jgi:DNA polymerase-3 subunit alpha
MKLNSNLKLDKAKPASQEEKLNWEKELLGLYITGHPLKNFKKILEEKTVSITNVINGSPPKTLVRIGGIISSIKKIITRKGLPMLFVKLEDLTDKVEVVVFPSVLERNPVVFQENKVVLVAGRVDQRDNTPKIICEEIEEIINK